LVLLRIGKVMVSFWRWLGQVLPLRVGSLQGSTQSHG
jgi:hypothetical protein